MNLSLEVKGSEVRRAMIKNGMRPLKRLSKTALVRLFCQTCICLLFQRWWILVFMKVSEFLQSDTTRQGKQQVTFLQVHLARERK